MSVELMLYALVLVAGGLAVAVVYIVVLRGHMAVVSEALDKPFLVANARGFWSRLDARLLGWKTVILASVAGLAQTVPALLNELLPSVASLPWVQVVDQRAATWISIVCTLAIPIVHATGMSRAAIAEPQDRV